MERQADSHLDEAAAGVGRVECNPIDEGGDAGVGRDSCIVAEAEHDAATEIGTTAAVVEPKVPKPNRR
jgi:hypothetical protein